MKTHLTEKFLRGLRPRAIPFDVSDDTIRSYGVRVLPTGEVVHQLYRIFPGSKKATRRKLGRFGNPRTPGFQPEMNLQAARDLASEWLGKIRKGIDPTLEAKREAQAAIEAERARRADAFKHVLESYFAHKSDLRSIHKMQVVMLRELSSWFDRPLADIGKPDVIELINKIKTRGARGQARATFLLTKAFFTWCVDSGYLTASPCASLKSAAFVGTSAKIERELDDHEIRALWAATAKVGHPIGSYFRMLLLTGLRRNEVADAPWSEIDLNARRWVIDQSRMKGKPNKTKPHLVPLTGEILALLDTLPNRTGYLFSNNGGAKQITSFSKMKAAIDAAMKAELAKEGRAFEPWIIHDLRRSVISRLSKYGVPESVGERIVAHAMPELTQRYNLYSFEPEKRQGLETWHRALKSIIERSTGDNVVSLRTA